MERKRNEYEATNKVKNKPMQAQTINHKTIDSISTRKRRTKITEETKGQIAELGKTNLSTREIESLTNIDHSTVAKILQRYGVEKQHIDNYISQRPAILQGLQEKILTAIDVDTIKDASLLQRVTAYGVLYDKERLETGKSTQNVQGIYHIISEIERNERKEVGSNKRIEHDSGCADSIDDIVDDTNSDSVQSVDSQGSTDGI